MAFLMSAQMAGAGAAAKNAMAEDLSSKLGGSINPLKDALMAKRSLNSAGIGGKGIPQLPGLSGAAGGVSMFGGNRPNMQNTLQMISSLTRRGF
jgi:hypothetical protein